MMNAVSLTHVKFIQDPSCTTFGKLHFLGIPYRFNIDGRIYS